MVELIVKMCDVLFAIRNPYFSHRNLADLIYDFKKTAQHLLPDATWVFPNWDSCKYKGILILHCSEYFSGYLACFMQMAWLVNSIFRREMGMLTSTI